MGSSLKVIEKDFSSHDLSSAKELLLHEAPNDRAFILEDINNEKVIDRLKMLLEIKDRDERKIQITQDHIDQIQAYLLYLDLIYETIIKHDKGKNEEYYIFTQPGMRYSIAKALVYSLMNDEYFGALSEEDCKYISNKILEDIKGRMLEDIVLLETIKAFKNKKDVFKLVFDQGGEYDMVIYDKEANTNVIFEIKHSDKVSERQAKNLHDEEKLKYVDFKYGKTTEKSVLYRGSDQIVGDVHYINVADFLISLP